MHNYLIEWTDIYSLNNKIKELIKKEDFIDIQINEYDLEDNDLDTILEDLDTYSLFSDKKIVIIKNAQLIDIEKNSGKHLLNYLENSNINNLLILSSNKLDSRKKLTKDLKKKCNYIKIEISPNEIIKNLLNEYELESGVSTYLLEWVNNDIDALFNECNKLIQYKKPLEKITKNDIREICYKRLGDPTNIVFDLVRNISSKDKKNSLKIYKKLKQYNVDDNAIIGLLESQLRLLEQVIILYSQDKRKKQIAEILDIHPYRIEKTIELMSYISKKDIDKLIINLADLDYKYKSGLDLSKNPLELFLLNI